MSSTTPLDPLVVTLMLDDAAQACFDRLRAHHFAPRRTVVGAHVTLFHALPGEGLARWVQDLTDSAPAGPLRLGVRAPRSLGRGVAYDLDCAELTSWHRQLQALWSDALTRQDAQPLRAHVTVANKLSPEQARRSLEELADAAVPTVVVGHGVRVWHYRGGPWEPARDVVFEVG